MRIFPYIQELCLSDLILRRASTASLIQCRWQGCTDSSFFGRDTALRQHIKEEHILPGVFKCSTPGCGETFDRLSKLHGHSRSHGDDIGHKGKQPTVHILQCGWHGCTNLQFFSCYYTLWRHIKEKHSLPGIFKCPTPGCGREFGRQDKLDEHFRAHGNNKGRKGIRRHS